MCKESVGSVIHKKNFDYFVKSYNYLSREPRSGRSLLAIRITILLSKKAKTKEAEHLSKFYLIETHSVFYIIS